MFVELRQAVRGHGLAEQHVLRLGLVHLAQGPGRCDRLGQRIDALEPLAPDDHRLADAPQVVERERAVLPAAVVVDPGPIAHREVAVADLASRPQHGAHLLDRVGVVAFDLDPVGLVALPPHHDPEGRQLLHRADGQPAAPFEELTPVVGQDRPVVDGVVDDPAGERQVVRPGDDDERIELEVLHRTHRGPGAIEAGPAAAGPQTLAPHDVAARRHGRDLDRHRRLLDPFDRTVGTESARASGWPG